MKIKKKKGNVTLCDLELHGLDIPNYEVNNFRELEELVCHWLDTKREKTVFVCFQSWTTENYENEHQRILVTNVTEDITLDELSIISNISIIDVCLSIFEFKTYEEAFKYCIDLKEGL